MMPNADRKGALILRLIVGLALLGSPRVGFAQGHWSVIATQGMARGQVSDPVALAVDAADNLYVAEEGAHPGYLARFQKRDARGTGP